MCSYFDFFRICDINEFKSKIFKYYEDERKLNTRSLPNLRTYVTFKQNVQLEPYVTINIIKHEQSLMAQFRYGIFLSKSKLFVIEMNLYNNVIVFCVRTDQLRIKNINCKFYGNIKKFSFIV